MVIFHGPIRQLFGCEEYIIRDGKVAIVDTFTGRVLEGRRWSDGMHQAIECKENISVSSLVASFLGGEFHVSREDDLCNVSMCRIPSAPVQYEFLLAEVFARKSRHRSPTNRSSGSSPGFVP